VEIFRYIRKLCDKYNLGFYPKTLVVYFVKAAHGGFLAVFSNSK